MMERKPPSRPGRRVRTNRRSSRAADRRPRENIGIATTLDRMAGAGNARLPTGSRVEPLEEINRSRRRISRCAGVRGAPSVPGARPKASSRQGRETAASASEASGHYQRGVGWAEHAPDSRRDVLSVNAAICPYRSGQARASHRGEV